MYKLLVIDDEQYAVDGILMAIDWTSIGITITQGVNSVSEAKEAMRRLPADIIICDIEMPDENGIDFLGWMRDENYHGKLIFLTGYSLFEYAQKSVGLGASDFLIKPVDHAMLKGTVNKVLQKLREERVLNHRAETFEKYKELWESQKPALMNRFWLDLLENPAKYTSPDDIRKTLDLYGIVLPTENVSMILVRSEWNDLSDAKWSHVMMYGLCNVAQEMLVANNGSVLRIDDNYCVIIFYYPGDCSLKKIEDFSEKMINALACELECYIYEDFSYLQISSAYAELKSMEARKLFSDKPIMCYIPEKDSYSSIPFPPLEILSAYIEAGKKDDIKAVINRFLQQISDRQTQPLNSLRVLYYRIVSVAMTALHQQGKGTSRQIDPQLLDESVCQNMSSFRNWVDLLIDGIVPDCAQAEIPNLMQKIQNYINLNVSQELTRESIASEFYLNPSYLSRLFHKETKEKLSAYILRMRIDKAKLMLKQTDDKLTSIAHAVGYNNDSYFIKVFKLGTGMTPHEYRKICKSD